jgi:RNA polymerase sigma-70 factor (ECF subfamily)
LFRFVEGQPDQSEEEAWRREYHANLLGWAADQIRPRFSAQTWAAFQRTAWNGEPAETVARDLGLTLNALYIARSRVTQKLREWIRDHSGEDSEAIGLPAHV